jgi:CHAT domain-containing protein
LKDKLWLLWATEGKVIGKREITNVGRQKLNEEVLKLRLLLQKPDSDLAELQKSARQLYDWLIQPLEAELKAGNIHHLVFSLDRGTRYIPMAVLFDGEKYLIEKYTVTTFISAEFTDTEDRLPPNGADTPILGVGAAKAPGYDPLPNVPAEIDSIVRENRPNDAQGIYPGNQFLDGDFTFLSLRDNLKGRKLLHIATHGEFVPGDQYLSYLVLGNGEKFSIADIQVLGDYLDDVHLVVLSACETALGDSFLTDPKQEEGIEINALSFYFLVSGAKTVMASLWRVDDTSTSLLMQRFYCTMANGNTTMTKSQALRKAQLSLLNNIKSV